MKVLQSTKNKIEFIRPKTKEEMLNITRGKGGAGGMKHAAIRSHGDDELKLHNIDTTVPDYISQAYLDLPDELKKYVKPRKSHIKPVSAFDNGEPVAVMSHPFNYGFMLPDVHSFYDTHHRDYAKPNWIRLTPQGKKRWLEIDVAIREGALKRMKTNPYVSLGDKSYLPPENHKEMINKSQKMIDEFNKMIDEHPKLLGDDSNGSKLHNHYTGRVPNINTLIQWRSWKIVDRIMTRDTQSDSGWMDSGFFSKCRGGAYHELNACGVEHECIMCGAIEALAIYHFFSYDEWDEETKLAYVNHRDNLGWLCGPCGDVAISLSKKEFDDKSDENFTQAEKNFKKKLYQNQNKSIRKNPSYQIDTSNDKFWNVDLENDYDFNEGLKKYLKNKKRGY